ncbi:MAG: succinate dehydrogenase, cytochrome b556 subunit [Rickettsia endosymbiont of Pseudomimeciton antennatum]|nr:succinate dehydrogenase, cytochrome b556 subunit [Rickettsia endosymbiont of Pseudomimeciton antennatum]MCC8398834.1 succinate dehydrogenase, cytochrome b556 subunit [Rickettsia endosymbiont of Labidopullus appendiculatus]
MTKTKQEIYNNRPTSPHLTIYKKQISSVLSILHRMTGIGLFFGLSILVWCFILLAFSKFNPEYLQYFKCSLFKIPLIFISFAWFYHLCNGVRHLIWDSGHCFSIRAINFTGWFVVIASIVMTLAFWLL